MRNVGCFVALTVFLSVMASASSRPVPFEVKVLRAESYTLKSPPIIPQDCNQQDFSAYCYGLKPVGYVENTMVVREPRWQVTPNRLHSLQPVVALCGPAR
jgi:hypothetical protein